MYIANARLISYRRVVNVESTGQYNPEELIPEALKILLGKIDEVEKGLDKLFEPQTSS